MQPKMTALALALPWLAATAPGQDSRPLAIVNARILTVADAPIEHGTVLVRDGKIAAVGANVDLPPGARVLDAAGGTVMPGLVSAWSSAGLTPAPRPSPEPTEGRRGRFRGARDAGGGPTNPVMQAATKVAPSIYARQDVFGELLQAGVTTLAVRPAGQGFPGLAALLDPSAKDGANLTIDDDAYVVVAPAANSKAKQLIKANLEKAQKIVEERKKPKAPPAEPKKPETPDKPSGDAKADPAGKPAEPPAEGTPPKEGEPKPAEKPEAPKEPEKKPEPKKDPNLELLADLLEGKQLGFVSLDSATELLHYLDCAGDHRFPAVVVAERSSSNSGRLDEVLSDLKKLRAPVLIRPQLDTRPYTDIAVNPAADLRAAGIDVGFLIGDSKEEVAEIWFRLMELVRHGLSAQDAIRCVTLTPAKMLKLDDRVGSIAVGKAGDLLVWSGDPLDPTSRLRHVIRNGRDIERQEQ